MNDKIVGNILKLAYILLLEVKEKSSAFVPLVNIFGHVSLRQTNTQLDFMNPSNDRLYN